MKLIPSRPNVELRQRDAGDETVVLAFPYDAHIVALVRTIPNRRFDWDTREWSAPAADWAGMYVAEVLERFPELTSDERVDAWLECIERQWIGHVRTTSRVRRGR